MFFQPTEGKTGYFNIQRFPVSVCLHLHTLFRSVFPLLFLIKTYKLLSISENFMYTIPKQLLVPEKKQPSLSHLGCSVIMGQSSVTYIPCKGTDCSVTPRKYRTQRTDFKENLNLSQFPLTCYLSKNQVDNLIKFPIQLVKRRR